jgi:hypothetical protein
MDSSLILGAVGSATIEVTYNPPSDLLDCSSTLSADNVADRVTLMFDGSPSIRFIDTSTVRIFFGGVVAPTTTATQLSAQAPGVTFLTETPISYFFNDSIGTKAVSYLMLWDWPNMAESSKSLVKGEGIFADLLRQRYQRAMKRLEFEGMAELETQHFTKPRKETPQMELL